jgi:hypothetical protein
MHHLPRLCGSNKSLPSSLNPSHPKTTSRAFVPRRRTTSAVAPMTYAQHTRPYERIPERQSSWGGGLPAGVNPPTASPSINTCLMHTDRSDGMPTTKEALTSACCSQHRIICCCLRSEFSSCPRSNYFVRSLQIGCLQQRASAASLPPRVHNGRLLANEDLTADSEATSPSAVRCSGHTRCSASHNGRLRRPSEANQVVHGAALHMRLQWSAVFFSAREGGRRRRRRTRRALLFTLRA